MFPGFKARNHPQQTATRGAIDEVDDRGTSRLLFASIVRDYGPFTIDVAASAENTKCDRYYTIDDDGLSQDWAGERVWCNPPFSNLEPWVRKAWLEAEAETIVMLLPANRTEQGWWQDLVEPYRDRAGSPLRLRFLRGRPRFVEPGMDRVLPNSRPPFGCCLLVWERIGPVQNPTATQLEVLRGEG